MIDTIHFLQETWHHGYAGFLGHLMPYHLYLGGRSLGVFLELDDVVREVFRKIHLPGAEFACLWIVCNNSFRTFAAG